MAIVEKQPPPQKNGKCILRFPQDFFISAFGFFHTKLILWIDYFIVQISFQKNLQISVQLSPVLNYYLIFFKHKCLMKSNKLMFSFG